VDLDRRLAELAARQHGLITLQQAIHLGATSRQIRWRISTGVLTVVRRNVYRFAGVPRTWHQSVLAAVLSCGSGVAASHDTALRLYGGRGDRERLIEVSSRRERRIDAAELTSHRSLVLFDADLSSRHTIPVTSPARIVVDLSGRRSDKELGRVVDDLLRRRLVRLPEIAQCAHRLRPAPGRSLATVHEALLQRWEGYDPGDSDLESRVLRAIYAAGLPVPRQQVRVGIGGRRCYLDLAYPELRIAIEIDSWAYHRFRSSFDGDRAKGNELVLLGWQVLRIHDGMTDAEIVALVARARAAMRDFGAA
jgi:very-short-patch-repair endonuclease